jgi:hypothetical protein
VTTPTGPPPAINIGDCAGMNGAFQNFSPGDATTAVRASALPP